MNNLDFFSRGCCNNWPRVEEAWAKFRKKHMLDTVRTHTEHDTIRWLLDEASTAYWYDLGSVVEPEPGKFATVTDYMKGGARGLEIYLVANNGGARWNLLVDADEPDEWNPKIPKGILDLARAQLQASCPLKEAKCQM